MKKVGELKEKVIKFFGLSYEAGSGIYLSPKRKRHLEKHRDEFADFDESVFFKVVCRLQ
ncbi:hypothetical protein ACLNCS_08435 [Streptococcus sp. CL9.43]|jgi:hypothetical protein|uniref:hypothetical protein n=1 Tax=Streptococcus sp. CL9.43 TaxID=3392238 RepID=UPI003C7AB177